MWPDQVSNPGPLTYESGALPIVLCGLACFLRNRFVLTVICCPIHHCLQVSHEVDIARVLSTSDIFTDDFSITSDILGNKLL